MNNTSRLPLPEQLGPFQAQREHGELGSALTEYRRYKNEIAGIVPENGFPMPEDDSALPMVAEMSMVEANGDSYLYQLIRERKALDAAFVRGDIDAEDYRRNSDYINKTITTYKRSDS